MGATSKVIDVHGHMSTPPQFRAFGFTLISLRDTYADLEISDELMETALAPHLAGLDDRGIDVQLISPRPIAMMHWERRAIVETWTRTTNDILAQQCRMHPDRFIGVGQLPQAHGPDTSSLLAELDRCINELGFVGAIVNPDPSGLRLTPAMTDPYWFPLYERAQELRAGLIIHPSISRDERIDQLHQGYQFNNLIEETLATLLFEQGDVFERFPNLRVVVCHCGGSLERLLRPPAVAPSDTPPAAEGAGGQVGLAVRRRRPPRRDVSRNLFFDTCAYDPHFLATAIRQRGPARMLFGTEAPGVGSKVVNPETGRPSDDLVPVIKGFDFLTEDDRRAIFAGNALEVLPLLGSRVSR